MGFASHSRRSSESRKKPSCKSNAATMDYTLAPFQWDYSKRVRPVPPRRPQNLRKGGGRKNSPGWTEQKRKTNRRRFNELRGVIQTCVTISYPAHATSAQLKALNDCNRNLCKEKHIPARSVWEGPKPHQHIALGIAHNTRLERLWLARLAKAWEKQFGLEMGQGAFLWKPSIAPDHIASYLSKTSKNGVLRVKMAYTWLTFSPCWEVDFRRLLQPVPHIPQPSPLQRKKRVNTPTRAESIHTESPRYTTSSKKTPEKKRELCTVCWHRWQRYLWLGSCNCSTLSISQMWRHREPLLPRTESSTQTNRQRLLLR